MLNTLVKKTKKNPKLCFLKIENWSLTFCLKSTINYFSVIGNLILKRKMSTLPPPAQKQGQGTENSEKSQILKTIF